MAEVIDLRGRRVAPQLSPVLADPSGRRARLLRRTGAAAAALALMWVVGLGLAGLGVLPTRELPFSGGLIDQAPGTWRAVPPLAPASRSDALPARPAAAASSGTRAASAPRRLAGTVGRSPSGTSPGLAGAGASHASGHGARHGSLHVRPYGAGTTVAGIPATPAPPTTTRTPRSQAAPGHTKSTTPGHSAGAPGQLKQTTTAPGNSGSAPGQTTAGHGHHNG
jgi:hypothetical protein